ncbi:GNAT family N-acetyltransferase [Silicimonas algicola]|nr:GNAT family N-acetyltransferase [Silicimonas algicola]
MTSGITLRRATPSDLGAVDALLLRSYPRLLKGAYPPSLLVTAIPLLSRGNPALLASGTYFVVEAGSTIVGAGGWTSSEPGTGRAGAPATGHVRHVATDPERTREGIGRALMAHIFDDARAAGITRLDCLSTLMAVPFYAACGFEAVGPVTVPLRPGIEFPAVRMHRSL